VPLDFRPSTFEIEGPLQTPDGRNPVVTTVWMIDTGAASPRLIYTDAKT
jgi:hypothetical protein